MLLRELQDIRSTLNKVAEQFGASRLRVFGSVARGEETAASDVDFLVDLPKGYDLFSQRIPLAQRLSELLNRRVELIPEHELNPHMRKKILDEAISL